MDQDDLIRMLQGQQRQYKPRTQFEAEVIKCLKNVNTLKDIFVPVFSPEGASTAFSQAALAEAERVLLTEAHRLRGVRENLRLDIPAADGTYREET